MGAFAMTAGRRCWQAAASARPLVVAPPQTYVSMLEEVDGAPPIMVDGSTPPVDLAIPVFGYQNHISLDRGFGFIRKWSATDAAAFEGRHLRDGLLDKT